jgi:outer membrane biosynthesis protein TonB
MGIDTEFALNRAQKAQMLAHSRLRAARRLELAPSPMKKDEGIEPVFPPIAKAARASGEVKVEVTTDKAGRVISARVLAALRRRI